jgi:hypothetical protein
VHVLQPSSPSERGEPAVERLVAGGVAAAVLEERLGRHDDGGVDQQIDVGVGLGQLLPEPRRATDDESLRPVTSFTTGSFVRVWDLGALGAVEPVRWGVRALVSAVAPSAGPN